MANEKYVLGVIGLGVMGRNLALNMAEHGYRIAGYDKDRPKVVAFNGYADTAPVKGFNALGDFTSSLEDPRRVLLLVPAGEIVDSVIRELLPHLRPKDIVIDAGNSLYADTDRRGAELSQRGLHFLGVGVSGGEEGARHGPSIMPGGPPEAYGELRPIFEAAAARADGAPCVAYLGPGSAGHYVKMVHNGIEYALMQLISETYDVMSRGLGLSNDELADIYGAWNRGPLGGFLIEITSRIFKKNDDKTDKRLIDVILDEAHQKGTGAWTTESAMALGVAVPNINIAVDMRYVSGAKAFRERESKLLAGPPSRIDAERVVLLEELRKALYAGQMISYAQGFALLAEASRSKGYGLDLETIASIWRGGCIIRSALLPKIMRAYRRDKRLPHLLADPELGKELGGLHASLRSVVTAAAAAGIPAPGLMASLAYYDGVRSARLPANLIQAQRDYFGSHTYERVDEKGSFHTEWSEGVRNESVQTG